MAASVFLGHYLGQDAVARSVSVVDEDLPITQSPTSLRKGSFLSVASLGAAPVDASLGGKGNFLTRLVSFTPATVEAEEPAPAPGSQTLSPAVSKLESAFRAGREERRRILAIRKMNQDEHFCLAKAIYFEARSESELGQMAVAKVILNRVKDPDYPKRICDVVYQNRSTGGSCQFSFACDGVSDTPEPGTAWEQSKRVATRAIVGDPTMKAVGDAKFYHADYVQPKWSLSMKRLTKIGRHIFYSDS
jgi:spore germination cell wall hydrolase CwlJ-like protein